MIIMLLTCKPMIIAPENLADEDIYLAAVDRRDIIGHGLTPTHVDLAPT